VAGEGFEVVGHIILSWNRVGPWLQRVDGLRAQGDLGPAAPVVHAHLQRLHAGGTKFVVDVRFTRAVVCAVINVFFGMIRQLPALIQLL
jgi:hypothetical protein